MSMRIAAVLCCLASGACGSDTPIEFLIYDRDPGAQVYRLTRSRILTLDDAHAGRGSVATLRGGGSLLVSSGEPQTAQEVRDALRITGDETPSIQWVERDNGVAMPLDFDSLMMLTLYHHLERASEYFSMIGVAPARVRALPVYYFTELKIALLPLPIPLLTDNAAYIVTLDAFFIPPRLLLNDVPLYANRGVVVHEYGHAVFNRVFHRDNRVPAYLLEDWPTETVNELRSLDEGLADIFAALAIGDADFIAPSISIELFEIDRDVSIERFYDTELHGTVVTGAVGGYDPYPLGSVVASALWALRSDVDDAVLGRAVITTLEALAGVGDGFRLTQFFDRFVVELPADARVTACQLFRDRLPAVEADLTC
ncbi:MAG: hypothetical protein V3T05_11925 [Myxococcota bacterium]